MKQQQQRLSRDPNAPIAITLAIGLAISLTVLAIGEIVALASGGVPEHTIAVSDLPHAFRSDLRHAIVSLGVLLLLVTPVAGVLAALIGFVRRRAWRFVGVTVLILSILTASVVAAELGLAIHV